MSKIITSFKNGLLNKSSQYRYYKSEYMLLKENLSSAQKKIEYLETNIKNTEDKLRIFNEEKEKICTIPNFEGLKLSLKGKEGYLFLINDSNNEIKQHFDQSYINKFNPSLFIENLKIKQDYCKNNNINYYFFMVPDKSYVCKELLPFNIKLIKRNYDLIKNLIPDFTGKLDHSCYWKIDSHINFLGGKEFSYHLLNHIDKNFKKDDFNKLINEQIIMNYAICLDGDLISPDNWSYTDEEREKYTKYKDLYLNNKFLKDLKRSLPEKFKFNSDRETYYYLNENGFTDLKVLILRDSSTIYLDNVLSIYFKEIILYWDHWIMNKELIEWYKPDIILEIITERFLDNMESIMNRGNLKKN